MLNENVYKALSLPVFVVGFWGAAILAQGINYEVVKWGATSLIIVSLGTLFWHFQFGEWPIETAEHIIRPKNPEDDLDV